MWLTERSHVALHDYESELSKLPRMEITGWFSKVGAEKRGIQWVASRDKMNPSFKLCWHPRKFLCFHGNCAKPFTGGDIRRVVSHLNRLTLTWDGCHFDYLQVLTVNVTVGLELVWNTWMVSKRSKSIYKDYETAYRIIKKNPHLVIIVLYFQMKSTSDRKLL